MFSLTRSFEIVNRWRKLGVITLALLAVGAVRLPLELANSIQRRAVMSLR